MAEEDELIVDSSRNDRLQFFGGDDGCDTLVGCNDDDQIMGGDGNDTLDAGSVDSNLFLPSSLEDIIRSTYSVPIDTLSPPLML